MRFYIPHDTLSKKKNGYEKEADHHFYKEKIAERRSKRINLQCNLKNIVERAISNVMDETIFKPKNILLQSIVAGVLSTGIPVFPMFILALFLAWFIPLLREFLEWAIADLTCKYGTDWKRPIYIWIGTVVLLFPLAYRELLNWSFLKALYHSALVAVTLGMGSLVSTSSMIIKALVIASSEGKQNIKFTTQRQRPPRALSGPQGHSP